MGPSDGKVYVPDSFNLRLKITDQLGKVEATLPCGVFPPPGVVSLLVGCTGVTQDAAGNIYAVAPSEHVVYKWDKVGNLIAKWGTANTPGSADGQFNTPYDVAIFGDRVYVSDSGNNRVQVFDTNGLFQGKWGSIGTAHGQFRGPRGLAVDAVGRIYVMDFGNSRIEVFRP